MWDFQQFLGHLKIRDFVREFKVHTKHPTTVKEEVMLMVEVRLLTLSSWIHSHKQNQIPLN